MATITAREFNQDVARAKRAANDGPVFITDRGKPAHVLLTAEAYERLAAKPRSIIEALAHPESAHIDFDLPERPRTLAKPFDFD